MTDNAKNLLTSAVQLIVAFFGAFGSFLQKLLPAQIDGQEFIYTYIQIVCVVIFLGIKFIILKNKTSKFWHWIIGISVVLFLGSGLNYYQHAKNTLRTVGKSDYKAVNGELSEKSKQICSSDFYREHPILKHMNCEQGILSMSTVQDLVWIYAPESVEKNINRFTILYIVLTLSLSIAIFSLLELIIANPSHPEPSPLPPSS